MPDTWVLAAPAVRQAIDLLRGVSVHPYFPAYLHLRQRAAAEGSLTGLRPNWNNELSTYLQVRNAPPSHPHFRPFTLGSGPTDAEWLNPNLAGSFAPSSLRAGQPPLQVVEIGHRPATFNLRPKHWELAREHLLGGRQMPLVPLAAFMLRDFAFELSRTPDNVDLIAAFAEAFGYTDASGPEELDHLYSDALEATSEWFEPFEQEPT